eukprot:SAG11_NODE_5802_length_1460_cov_2.934607_1_plen_259_part_00
MRLDEPATWKTFRANFAKHVQVVRTRAVKLPLRIPHLEAIALDADLSKAVDRLDMSMYSLAFFAAPRCGHFTPKSLASAHTVHLLRWRQVLFVPKVADPSIVFLHVPSTKIRNKHYLKPWWTAVGRNEVFGVRFCPVRLLQLRFLRDFGGNLDSFIFEDAGGRPVVRADFTRRLRVRLQRAAPRLGLTAADFGSQYWGISLRKGAGSALALSGAADRQVADHLDHASVDMSRRYVADDAASRAANTGHMALGFASPGP